jgi:hypothetical protein
MPYRDPSERIAKVGQGFSKMLSMINPDALSRYDQQHTHSTKVSHDMHGAGDSAVKDSRIHTIHHKTQNNFFHQSPGKSHQQDMMRRPGSAQVLPRPKRTAHSKKRQM